MFESIKQKFEKFQRARRTKIRQVPGAGRQVVVKKGEGHRKILSNGYISKQTAKMLKRLYVQHNIVIPACTVNRTDDSSVHKTDYQKLGKAVTKYGDKEGVERYYEWANGEVDEI